MTLLRDMTREDREQAVNNATSIIRQDYHNDVRDIAEDVMERMREAHNDGQRSEKLRETLTEYMHETIDGCGRVIYTWQSQLGLLATDNDEAYVEEFGAEGMVEDGEIQWSRLMFAALERDVYKQLEAEGLDANNPQAMFDEDEE